MSSIGIENPLFEADADVREASVLPSSLPIAADLAVVEPPEDRKPIVPWVIWRFAAVLALVAGLTLAFLPFQIDATDGAGSATCSAAMTEAFTFTTDRLLADSGEFQHAAACFNPARARLAFGLGLFGLGLTLGGVGRLYTQGQGTENAIFVSGRRTRS